MLKNICKRVLSTVLVLTLIATTFFIFDPTALFPKAEAAVTQTGSALMFFPPEAIYLYPDGVSFKSSTSGTFQYYLNSTNTGTIPTSVANRVTTTGKLYVGYKYATGTSKLTYRFVDRYMNNALSGGSVTLSASEWTGATINASGGGKTVDITAGSSPSLASDVTGCYIEWKYEYTDSLDNVKKYAYAFTYVYKPCTKPLGAGIRNKYYSGYAGSIGWISGVHSITAQAIRSDTETDGDASLSREMGYPSYTYHKDGNNWVGLSFAAFISKSAYGYVNGTKTANGAQHRSTIGTVTYATGATEGYAIYANTAGGSSETNAHFDVTPSNNNADNWINKGTSGVYNYPEKSFQYNNASSSKDYVVCRVWNNSYANINIDTSRFTDLSQIPNLSVGLLVTDDQGTANNSAGWYRTIRA